MQYDWRDEDGASAAEPGGVVVSSFPSAGLAATVAARYMIGCLELPRVGRFESPETVPIAVIQGGQVNPPIRVYGRKGISLILSEFPPSLAQVGALARTIFDGAERRKARLLIGFEGVMPNPESPDGNEEREAEEQIWVATSRRDDGLAKILAQSGARPLEDGVIGGVSGALLVEGLRREIPVAILLVGAHVPDGFPDHRAGATLVEAFDRLVPELRVDTGPLRVQAERIERMLRSAMKAQPQVADRESTPVAPMYQ